jgi:hypothetical protein
VNSSNPGHIGRVSNCDILIVFILNLHGFDHVRIFFGSAADQWIAVFMVLFRFVSGESRDTTTSLLKAAVDQWITASIVFFGFVGGGSRETPTRLLKAAADHWIATSMVSPVVDYGRPRRGC